MRPICLAVSCLAYNPLICRDVQRTTSKRSLPLLCLPLPLSLRISLALLGSLSLTHFFLCARPRLPPPHPHFQRCHPHTPNFNVDGVRVPCAALKHPCTIPSPTPHPCRTTLKSGGAGGWAPIICVLVMERTCLVECLGVNERDTQFG